MKKITTKRSVFLVFALMASEALFARSLFIESPRDAMPEFVMPTQEKNNEKQNLIFDSDPRSRKDLIERIQAHKGMSWKNFDRAYREHISFTNGSYRLTEDEKARIKQFIEKYGYGKSAVVYGFADDKGSYELNKNLSFRRAESVANLFSESFSDVVIFSSTDWPGDPDKGRRVDVLVY